MGPSDSYSNCMICLLTGRAAINQATNAARTFGDSRKLGEDKVAQLCIIIEELVTNLFDHGGVTSTDQVELMLVGEPHGIRLILVDPGRPFDPRSATPSGPNEERGGNAGLEIVRTWAEIVGYYVTSEGNKLEIMLPLR